MGDIGNELCFKGGHVLELDLVLIATFPSLDVFSVSGNDALGTKCITGQHFWLPGC